MLISPKASLTAGFLFDLLDNKKPQLSGFLGYNH